MKVIFNLLLCLVSFSGFSQSDFSAQVGAIQKLSAERGIEEPVIFIGSSSIRMWKTLEQDFSDFPVLNHGFGGSEYSDIIKYQSELIEEFEPSMVIVYAGDNDIANGEEPSAIAEEAGIFVDGMRRFAHGAPVIVLSVKPSIARWELKDRYVELNGLLEKVAYQYEHVVYVDVWTPMLKRNGELKANLFIDDGLHINEKGYEIWKNALLPFLSR